MLARPRPLPQAPPPEGPAGTGLFWSFSVDQVTSVQVPDEVIGHMVGHMRSGDV